jgi:hypothetical protein
VPRILDKRRAVHIRPTIELSREQTGDALTAALTTIRPSDFPMRLVFLDKSGSMHANDATLSALALGFYNAATPARGSTLTLLLSAPGETQVFFAVPAAKPRDAQPRDTQPRDAQPRDAHNHTARKQQAAATSAQPSDDGANIPFSCHVACDQRAGEPAPSAVRIPLGSATWFNEPVIRCLSALAPHAERLLTASRGATREVGGGAPDMGGPGREPPLSVFCLTDGMDNVSPSALGSLHGLVSAIDGLVGPERGRPVYEPRAPGARGAVPRGRRATAAIAAASERVPVWLMWIVLNDGGRQFSEAPLPSAITLVDASPCSSSGGGNTSGAPATSRRDDEGDVQPGHLVTVRAPAGAVVPTTAREALVLEVVADDEMAASTLGEAGAHAAHAAEGTAESSGGSSAVLVMYTAFGGTERVCASRCRRIRTAAAEAPSAAPAMRSSAAPAMRSSDESTLALVDAAFTDPAGLARAATLNAHGVTVVPATTPVPAVDPSKLRAVRGLAASSIDALEYAPVGRGLVLSLITTLGRAAQTLDAPGRAVAQRIVYAVLGEVAAGRTVLSGHFLQRYAPDATSRARRTSGSTVAHDEARAKFEDAVCAPALRLLERLTALGVLTANERAFGCSRAQCACSAKYQQAFTAWDPNMPSIAAAARLVHPSGGDGLGRCCAHVHRAYAHRSREPNVVAHPD